jgi:hypothetical protein
MDVMAMAIPAGSVSSTEGSPHDPRVRDRLGAQDRGHSPPIEHKHIVAQIDKFRDVVRIKQDSPA